MMILCDDGLNRDLESTLYWLREKKWTLFKAIDWLDNKIDLEIVNRKTESKRYFYMHACAILVDRYSITLESLSGWEI
jgi:hypothetical protein